MAARRGRLRSAGDVFSGRDKELRRNGKGLYPSQRERFCDCGHGAMRERIHIDGLMKRLRIDSMMVLATLGATALMASHVAAKATRDAFFLSRFGVTALPIMVIAASLVSIVVSVMTPRLNRSLLPTRILPHMFVASSGLLLVEWWISTWNPVLAAV